MHAQIAKADASHPLAKDNMSKRCARQALCKHSFWRVPCLHHGTVIFLCHDVGGVHGCQHGQTSGAGPVLGDEGATLTVLDLLLNLLAHLFRPPAALGILLLMGFSNSSLAFPSRTGGSRCTGDGWQRQ